MKRIFALLIGLLIPLACSTLLADTITFTDLTTASGTIGSTSFTSEPITIVASGDTSSIQPCGASCVFIDNNLASITIGGLGTFLFTTGTRFFDNYVDQEVGFSRSGITGSDLIDGPVDPAFSSWSMLTSIGPITGIGVIFQWNNIQCPTCGPLPDVVTNGGVLVLDNASPDVTFSAQVSSSVPEPSTFLLLATGFLGVGWLVRQKGRRLPRS